MILRVLLLSPLLVLALWISEPDGPLVVPTAPTVPPAPSASPPDTSAAGLRGPALCSQPLAPIDVRLQTLDQPGGDALLSFEVAPLRPLRDLGWSLSTGPGVTRLAGDDGGALPSEGGAAQVRLGVPRDGRYAEAELVVHGTLPGTDEPVAVSRLITWGSLASVARPTESLAGVDGEPVTVAALPVARLQGPRRTPSGTDVPGADLATFQVSGRFLYEDKAWGVSGWTGEDPLLPVRHADVTVIDAGAAQVLATGWTADDGSFSLTCQAAGPLDLVIRCDAASVYDPAFQPTRVHPIEGWTYVLFADPVLDHDPAFDLDIGTYASPKELAGSGEGSAFNLFDMAVSLFELMLDPKVGAEPIPDRMIEQEWPAGSETHAFLDGTVIGNGNGYDDAVILHELGHVVHFLWSPMNPVGGSHTFGDSDQDPRLSLGEGFATFLEGLVLLDLGRPAYYVDSSGSAQFNGFQLRMIHETGFPYTQDARGIADEVAVCCALYDLLDDELSADDGEPGLDDDPMTSASLVAGKLPAQAFWDAFVAELAPQADHTQNDLWDRWFAVHPVDAQLESAAACFAGFGQVFSEDAAEPNGTPASATPLTPVEGPDWSGPFTLYRTDDVSPAPGNGDQDWFVHDLVIGSRLKFVTRYPGGANDADTQADTRLELFDPAGQSVAFDLDSGVGRNARLDDVTITESGAWTVQVTTQDPIVRRYGRYEYRAQMLFENHQPELVGAPFASPSVLVDGATATLIAQATDANAGQQLAYLWTPLDGGTITGSGAEVTYQPPTVDAPTELAVQVVVVDELGAESAPALVTLLVSPGGVSPCQDPADVLAVGVGKPGLLGAPVLSAVGLPVLPSADLILHVEGALPGLSGWLVVGLSALDGAFDGGTLHPQPDLLVSLTADANGEALLGVPLPAAAELCGLTVATQAVFVGDPGATGALQTAQSNGLDLTFGR